MRRIERALLLVGVLSLGWVSAVYLFAKLDQVSQNRELEELRARRTVGMRPARDIALPARASESPAPSPRPQSLETPRREPVEGALIGRVEVPRLGVSAIVREGVASSTLRRAVGHVPETALPGQTGNAALAAHRDTFFRALKDVRTGDRIHITTPDGLHEYRVSKTRVVSPDDVTVLDPTPEPTLTLITCYPFNYIGSAPERFIVTATATSGDTSSSGPSADPTPAPSEPPPAAVEPVALASVVPAMKPVPSKTSGSAKRRIGKVTTKNSGRIAKAKKPSALKRPVAERTVAKGTPGQRKPGIWKKMWRVFKG